MVFWSVEVKPDQPYLHESGLGRLRISQAIVGNYYDAGWTTLQCSVGYTSPVRLCALSSSTTMRQLDLEFDESENVVLSVLGNCSIHLSGYYMHRQNADEKTSEKRKSNTPSEEEAPNYPNIGMDRENEHKNSKIMKSNTVDISPGQSHDIKENAMHNSAQENQTQGDEVQHQSADPFIKKIDPIIMIPDDDEMSIVDQKPGDANHGVASERKEVCVKYVGKLVDGKENAMQNSAQENQTRGDEVQHQNADTFIRIPDDGEMSIVDLEPGDANHGVASEGKEVCLKYVGKLVDGKAFDPSEGTETYNFKLGARDVIAGWNRGIEGMCVGGTRRLSIPPALGFGDNPADPVPPNSWLFYEVELLSVSPVSPVSPCKMKHRATPTDTSTSVDSH